MPVSSLPSGLGAPNEIRASHLISALSYALDLTEGQPTGDTRFRAV